MPYTLAKALLWLVLAGVLGIVIGWLLRSVGAHRQISRAKSQHPDNAELQRLRARVAELEAATPAGSSTTRAVTPAVSSSTGPGATPAPEPAESAPTAIIEAATAELGQPVALDDLKVIEGIGLTIEDLCHGIGIRTWSDMAATEPSLLRTMLNDAGPRFKTHDPTAWPQQARLLAEGRWAEFRTLVEGLRDGVASS